MKKRLMIFCSLISLLLVGFQFPIYAEENPSDTQSSVPVPNSIRLDAYFYDNYDLLPYIESDGQQYINTNINPTSNYRIDLSFGNLSVISTDNYNSIFSTRDNGGLGVRYLFTNNTVNLSFSTEFNNYEFITDLYNIYSLSFDENAVYLNNSLIHSFPELTYTSNYPIYIFANNNSGAVNQYGAFRLYKFNIYDYSTESYLRYYYPARSKSGGVIGLYDAVSDTFVTTSGSVPFASPIADQVLNLQIGSFLTAGLGWIGDILEFAVETPIIMIFMAIGLAGAMFRWSRRLVHF